MEGLLTLTQAAERMGCKRQWVHQLIKERRLKARKLGGIYILREKDVDACEVRARAKPSANGHTSRVPQKRKKSDRSNVKTKAGKQRTKQPL